jgi:high-affinity iron transporter
MLPTFVIGLREGVEASLIVSIIAAFLGQQGRRDALKWVWTGVGLAVALCLAAGIALHVLENSLPQKEQEALETVIALVAVAMVTWMIMWMRKHARGLKGEIEATAGSALVEGSAKALIVMAFLAVLREGFETSFFLVALMQNADSQLSGLAGALLGIVVACAIGVALYKGGLKLNLAKFFRATGVVLVVVVAGLAAFAAHTAHEAGWLTVGQDQLFDLSSFIKPGSVQAALVTGILGIQPKPVVAEAVAWLVAFVPLLAFVLWPPRGPAERSDSHSASSNDARTAVGSAS